MSKSNTEKYAYDEKDIDVEIALKVDIHTTACYDKCLPLVRE